jgi:hypothetical protein
MPLDLLRNEGDFPLLRNDEGQIMATSNAERQAKWRAKRNALAKQAEAMAPVTSKRRGRRARPIGEADDFSREIYDFLSDFEQRFNAWLKLGSFSKHPFQRDTLVDALHYTANKLSIMAQRLAGFSDN